MFKAKCQKAAVQRRKKEYPDDNTTRIKQRWTATIRSYPVFREIDHTSSERLITLVLCLSPVIVIKTKAKSCAHSQIYTRIKKQNEPMSIQRELDRVSRNDQHVMFCMEHTLVVCSLFRKQAINPLCH